MLRQYRDAPWRVILHHSRDYCDATVAVGIMTPAPPSPGDEWLAPNSEPDFLISRTAIIMIRNEPYKYNETLHGGRI
jgi:hypothetical protein